MMNKARWLAYIVSDGLELIKLALISSTPQKKT
jgi:hypothetical protein